MRNNIHTIFNPTMSNSIVEFIIEIDHNAVLNNQIPTYILINQ